MRAPRRVTNCRLTTAVQNLDNLDRFALPIFVDIWTPWHSVLRISAIRIRLRGTADSQFRLWSLSLLPCEDLALGQTRNLLIALGVEVCLMSLAIVRGSEYILLCRF